MKILSLYEIVSLRANLSPTQNFLNFNGSCSDCGACCDRVLMMSLSEITQIRRYLAKNPEICKQIEEINQGLPHRMCPFLDHTRPHHKCLIYTVRPIICRYYVCDERRIDGNGMLRDTKKLGEIPYHVDLWNTFLGDSNDIAPAWRVKDFLEKDTGMRFNPEFLMEPENLPKILKKFRIPF